MVSSGGSGTSSAPNIPAPSGQLNPTPGGAAPAYASFLGNLGPGQMATGLTPEMIQQIQGGGYSPTPPPMAQPPPMQAPQMQQARDQLAQMMRQQALAAYQTPERGFNAPRGRGGVGGGNGRAGGQGGSGGGLY